MKLSNVCSINIELELKSEIILFGNSSGPLFSIGFDCPKGGAGGGVEVAFCFRNLKHNDVTGM